MPLNDQHLLDILQRGLGQIRDSLKAGVQVDIPDWASSAFLTVSNTSALENERRLAGTVNQITLTDNGVGSTLVLSTPQDLDTAATVQFGTLTLNNTGLHLLDTNASHDLIIAPGSDLTADRTLTLTTGDAARTLTLDADVALNQSLRTTDSPTFAALELTSTLTTAGIATFNGNVAINANITFGNATSDLVSFVGRIATDVLPNTDGGRDLGSTTQRYAEGYFATGVNIGTGTAPGSVKLRIAGTPAWLVQDESDTDPTTTELDSLDSTAIYNKSDKFVIAYNNAGTITYISIPLDGTTTTWTHSTTAP